MTSSTKVVITVLFSGGSMGFLLRKLPELCQSFSKGLSEKFLIGEGTVSLGRVEKGNSQIESRADQLHCTSFFRGWAITAAQTHAAESESETSRLLFPSVRFFIFSMFF